MGRASSIKSDPAVQREVDRLLGEGFTYRQIQSHLAELGKPRSHSAIGAYGKNWRALTDRQRDVGAAAEAFAKEFGSKDDHQNRLMLQLMTLIITNAIMPHAAGEKPKPLDPLATRLLAQAVKDVIGAGKLDEERLRATRKETLADAQKAAERAGRRAGASSEQLRLIKEEIMGIKT